MRLFDQDAYTMMRRIIDPARPVVFFDVGAHVGAMSRRMLEAFPEATVHAFEPADWPFRTLQRAAAEHPRLHAHRVAAADEPGRAELRVTGNPEFSSLLPPAEAGRAYYGAWVEVVDHEPVERVRLDDWAEARGIEHVHGMKIDVQGGELDVLRGAENLIRRGVEVIYCEAQIEPEYEGASTLIDIGAFLRDAGFALHQIHEIHCKGPERQSSVCDGLWVRREALSRLRADPDRAYWVEWTERLRHALQECERKGFNRVALYGLGSHTRAVAEELAEPPVEIVCMIDDDPSRQGRRLWGFPVVSQEEAVKRDIAAAIISSQCKQEALNRAASTLRAGGVEVIRLYEG